MSTNQPRSALAPQPCERTLGRGSIALLCQLQGQRWRDRSEQNPPCSPHLKKKHNKAFVRHYLIAGLSSLSPYFAILEVESHAKAPQAGDGHGWIDLPPAPGNLSLSPAAGGGDPKAAPKENRRYLVHVTFFSSGFSCLLQPQRAAAPGMLQEPGPERRSRKKGTKISLQLLFAS